MHIIRHKDINFTGILFLFGLINFVNLLGTFLFNFFNVLYYFFHKYRVLTGFLFLGSTFFYIYAWDHWNNKSFFLSLAISSRTAGSLEERILPRNSSPGLAGDGAAYCSVPRLINILRQAIGHPSLLYHESGSTSFGLTYAGQRLRI